MPKKKKLNDWQEDKDEKVMGGDSDELDNSDLDDPAKGDDLNDLDSPTEEEEEDGNY